MLPFSTSLPQISSSATPTLPSLSLTAEEQALMAQLGRLRLLSKFELELAQAYYDGEQVVDNLRIAVPRELEFLRTIVGWGAKAVDPYVRRVNADCYRLPDKTDGDEHLADVMEANRFAFEQPMAVRDALTLGHGLWTVGSPEESGGAPVVTVESPLATSVLWDRRGQTARALLSHYYDDGQHKATFMAPGRTIHLAADDGGQWEIKDRDDHGFDFVPVVRMAHEASTTNRGGRSAITPALRSLIASACRRLLGLEVASEIYSVPGKVILGASEDAFIKSDGSRASAWETYIHMTLGLDAVVNPDTGETTLPQVHQWQPMDPSVFTKVLDWYASAASAIVYATPQDMGLYTQGNPPTAESIDAMNNERTLQALHIQREFEPAYVDVAKMVLRFENGGQVPEAYRRLALDWNPVNVVNPVLVSDGITKQIAAGAIPPRSDVTAKRLGYSSVERSRIERDWKDEDARQAKLEVRAQMAARRQAAQNPQDPKQGATGGNAGQ